MTCRPRHFTRLELLVVVMVITITLAMLTPVFRKATENMKRVNCSANFKSIGLSINIYSDIYSGFFPNINSRGFGGGSSLYGNWQPLGSLKFAADNNHKVWACTSSIVAKSDADCSNYRYIGSGLRDDNESATLVTLGYDASGNHPENSWMGALFIDGHVEGNKPDGSRQVTIIETLPDKTTRSSTTVWNRNDW